MELVVKSSFLCPQCNRLDMVESVEAIVSAGTTRSVVIVPYVYSSQGEIYTDYTGTPISHQSNLAEVLKCPQYAKPEEPKREVGQSISIFFAFILMSGSIFWLLIGVFQGNIPYIIVSLVSFGLGYAYYDKSKSQNQEMTNRYYEYMDASSNIEKKNREIRDKWEKLRYCKRDNIVFLPGSSRVVHPRQMSELLYVE